jgi:predicted small metal-binding protein
MTRKYIDCRENPQASQGCSVAISADTDEELIEAAVEHAVKVHGYDDTLEFREQMKDAIKEGEPRT